MPMRHPFGLRWPSCLPLLLMACHAFDVRREFSSVVHSSFREMHLPAFSAPMFAASGPHQDTALDKPTDWGATALRQVEAACQHGNACAAVRGIQKSALSLRMGKDTDNSVVFVPGAKKQPQRMEGSRWDQWYAPMSSSEDEEDESELSEAEQEVEEDEEWKKMSKLERLRVSTEVSLDWKVLKGALVDKAVTTMGRTALEELRPLSEVEEVEEAFEAQAEIRLLRDSGVSLPLHRVKDVRAEARKAAKGDVLELEELHVAAQTVLAMQEIFALLYDRNDTATLTDFAQDIDLDEKVLSTLERSFDLSGQLSTKMYPQLLSLRKEIDKMAAAVTTTMESLVKRSDLKETLQDNFYTIRDNRFVLPVAITNKNKVSGIVHGVSATGSTVYIEPQQVIDLNNRLRLAEGELKAEETRIQTLLSQRLGALASPIARASLAVTRLDLAASRELLAQDLLAARPEVRAGGVLRLAEGRHPVLALRGVEAVPNDIALDDHRPALVISGPNAGGKTVALKTVGLSALLVQHGCWVPAGEGSRVDLFSAVLASIGDAQAVEEGLSSFSSHLALLRTMLQAAAPGALLLLDEIASGTDPAQGAPLAQAILERLLDAGPRLVVTTHYAQLKALATVDERFAVAAMQFVDGAPSYKVLHGVTGESHALSIAEKMGLDGGLLGRAEELMGEQAKMTKTLEALESERARAQVEAEEAEAQRKELEAKLAEVEAREAAIRERSRQLEQEGAAAFLRRLKAQEQEIAAVVKELQQGPSFKQVDAARAKLDALRDGLPVDQAAPAEGHSGELQEGDTVLLLDLNSEGVVVAPPNAKGDVQVRLGAISLRTSVDKLQLVNPASAPAQPKGKKGGGGGGGGKKGGKAGGKAAKKALAAAVRTPSNTLDLRGCRAEDVGEEVDQFLDKMLRASLPTCFLLTGHGTGVVKKVVQEHLAGSLYAAAFAPASFEQGGDALTVVALR